MFSKKPDQAPEAPRSRKATDKTMAGNNSTFSVIGSDVKITGNVSASTELHVDGHIEGDITCASLVQGADSVIDGAITAESARMSGTVSGSITARELVILKSARIRGDVHYNSLTIEQGAQVEGRFAPQNAAGGGMISAMETKIGGKGAAGDEEPKLTLAT